MPRMYVIRVQSEESPDGYAYLQRVSFGENGVCNCIMYTYNHNEAMKWSHEAVARAYKDGPGMPRNLGRVVPLDKIPRK